MFVTPPLPSSVLAFATTIHLAMAVLRSHRSAGAGPVSFVGLVSILFSASPWMLPAPVGVAVGLLAHASFFAACELILAPMPALALASSAAPAVAARPRPIAAHHIGRLREFVQVPILAVVDETSDVKTFRMARPNGFEFQAGQFLTIRVRAEGRDHARCYSISSPPHLRGCLEISVKRCGTVSGALHATLRPGAVLSIKGPGGAMVCPADDDRPLVLVAGGVGITPLMSILRHSLNAAPVRPVTLFYSVRTEQDLAFGDEQWLLARRHAQFRLVVAITGGTDRADLYPGRIDKALIVAMAPGITHSVSLVCGPPPMLEAVVAMLVEIGVPAAQIRKEVFELSVAATGKPRPPREADEAPSTSAACQLRFARSGREVRVRSGETLLEVAEACGAGIPSLCRAGVCGTCRTKVLTGEVQCDSQMLDEQERADGFVLACVTSIRSDCTVDA